MVFVHSIQKNVKLDPILRQPKKFLRKPKGRDKKRIVSKFEVVGLKQLGFARAFSIM